MDGGYQLSKKVSLPGHQTVAMSKLCEVGWLYRQLHQYTEAAAQETGAGLVSQSFVTAVRSELTEYYRLLAGLEQDVKEGGVRLLQLQVWTRQPQARLRLLVEVVTSLGRARGGALVTKLYSFLSQGDPQLGQCVTKGAAASWVRTCDRRAAHIIRRAEADPAVQETAWDPEQEYPHQVENSHTQLQNCSK